MDLNDIVGKNIWQRLVIGHQCGLPTVLLSGKLEEQSIWVLIQSLGGQPPPQLKGEVGQGQQANLQKGSLGKTHSSPCETLSILSLPLSWPKTGAVWEPGQDEFIGGQPGNWFRQESASLGKQSWVLLADWLTGLYF